MSDKPKILLVILSFLFVLGLAVFEIYAWVTYGDKPIEEIPSWALWLMFGSAN